MRINDYEFDYPFTVHADGTVTDADASVWAPEVMHDDDDDVAVYSPRGLAWEPLTGYTGQYGYSGAVMHPSEYIGGGLERDILAVPGTYVVTAVNDEDGDAIGWAVLRLSE